MDLKSLKNSSGALLSMAIASALTLAAPAFCQDSGTNQMIFQDENQIMRQNAQQLNQTEMQEQQYKSEVQSQDAKDEPYRLYAQQRIQALQQLRKAGGSPVRNLSQSQQRQMLLLSQWLQKDDQTRQAERAHLRQLDQAIANLQESINQAQGNMQSQIQDMHENQEIAQENNKFNQMMQINQFNELQSEMGNVGWGSTAQDGIANSVGGRYGFMGGYSYGLNGRRFGY